MPNIREFLVMCTVTTFTLGIVSVSHARGDPVDSSSTCGQIDSRAKSNCKLVVEFYQAFFNRHEIEAAERALDPSYIQHNPQLPNGRDALVGFFAGYFRDHPRATSEIIHVAASGDLVWLHVHDMEGPRDRGNGVVDIFRVRDGRIVEHWDVIQEVPRKSSNQ